MQCPMAARLPGRWTKKWAWYHLHHQPRLIDQALRVRCVTRLRRFPQRRAAASPICNTEPLKSSECRPNGRAWRRLPWACQCRRWSHSRQISRVVLISSQVSSSRTCTRSTRAEEIPIPHWSLSLASDHQPFKSIKTRLGMPKFRSLPQVGIINSAKQTSMIPQLMAKARSTGVICQEASKSFKLVIWWTSQSRTRGAHHITSPSRICRATPLTTQLYYWLKSNLAKMPRSLTEDVFWRVRSRPAAAWKERLTRS